MRESRISPGTVYRAVLLAFTLVVIGLLFKALITLVLAVLVVVVLALPLSAFATQLARFHVPRALGALLALLIGLGLIALLVAAIVPVFNQEINRFTASLPGIVISLRHRVGQLTGTSAAHVGKQLQTFVNGYTQHPSKLLGPLESIGASIAGIVAALIVILLTALYTAIHPDPLRNGVIRLVPPAHRDVGETILDRLRVAYLGWLKGLVVGALVLGGMTYIGLRVVGLQFAAFFAIFTAIAIIVPYFGALASSIPPILYALTVSPSKAIVVAGIYVVAHQLESNIIQPLVVARAVKMHPALIAVGVVAVDRLFGFIGLIVAVPILATIQTLVQELWVRPIENQGPELVVARASGTPSEPVIVAAGTAGRGFSESDDLAV